MIIAKKVRLIPTSEQERLLFNYLGCARFAYNHCKKLSDKYYKLFGKSVSQVDLQKYFTKMKKRKKFAWLNDINAQVPKQASRDFDTARERSFKNFGNGYHINWKSKHKDLIQSFYSNYETIQFTKKGVVLQSVRDTKKNRDKGLIFGEIRTSSKLPRNRVPSNPRVSYDGRYWWLSVGFREFFEPQELTGESIGVDVGIKELYVASNEMSRRNINKDAKVKKLMKRKKSAQRDMSRRFVKGTKIQSNNYEKAKKEHLRLSRKLTDIRNNHIHQATNELVKVKPSRIVVEDLKIANLMKNKKLSKAFTYQKLNMFFRCLKYKCEKNGIEYVKADKWFASSKTCSCCGNIYDHRIQSEGQWSLKIRKWTCVHCNSNHDRDLNASINLSRWSN
jgi:putative transposase